MDRNPIIEVAATALVWCAVLGAAASTPATAQSAASGQEAMDLVAVQVREQGHPCDKPQSAERQAALSHPGEDVWILTCEDATYRVKLIPDMAADVEKIE